MPFANALRLRPAACAQDKRLPQFNAALRTPRIEDATERKASIPSSQFPVPALS
jgi:hypothetical protein